MEDSAPCIITDIAGQIPSNKTVSVKDIYRGYLNKYRTQVSDTRWSEPNTEQGKSYE